MPDPQTFSARGTLAVARNRCPEPKLPSQTPTNESLLRRYQQGDAEAARELVRQTTSVLFRSVAAFVADPAEVEDILQDGWLRIHSARHTWRSGEPALPWLLAIVRYTRADHMRRKYRRREDAIEALAAEPQASAAQFGEKTEVMRLLAALPDSQREVLLMLKVEGLTLEETARATGSTIGAVKQKASRAYAKLRALLPAVGASGSAQAEKGAS